MDMRPPELGGDFDTSLQNYYSFSRKIGLRNGRLNRQVHGAKIIKAAQGMPKLPLLPTIGEEGDAIWTDEPGSWVGVLTADCVPILFETKDKVMAVHAGWRSLAAGILKQSISFLGGAETVVQVTFGPSARGCCYTVHQDVTDQLKSADLEPVTIGTRVDLPQTAESYLKNLGIKMFRQSDPYGCTICDRRFHSHRRDGISAGRNLSVIGIL